jgi:hypothetical protein
MKFGLRGVTVDEFGDVFDRVLDVMQKYGTRNNLKMYVDYDLYEPYNGWSQVLVYVLNLKVLHPRLVAKLRRVVSRRPNWEIVVAVAVEEHLQDWPEMGIRIRAHEIVDALQRDFFPPEFKGLAFEDARPAMEDE